MMDGKSGIVGDGNMTQPPIEQAPDGSPYEQFVYCVRVKIYQRWLKVLDKPNAVEILKQEFKQVLDEEMKMYWCRGCKKWLRTNKIIGWQKCWCTSCFYKKQ